MKKYQLTFLALAMTAALMAGCSGSTLAVENNSNGRGSEKNNPELKKTNQGGPPQEDIKPGKPVQTDLMIKREENNNKPLMGKPLTRELKISSPAGGLQITEDGFSKHGIKPLKGSLLKLDEKIGSRSGEATNPGKMKKLLSLRITEASGEATVSATSKRRAIQGVISALLGDLMTLSHQIHRDRMSSILITGAQIFQPKNQASSSGTLQVGQRVIVFGEQNNSGQLVAKRIRIIPGKATGISSKTPTSTPTSTPSATTSPTSTPEASATAEPSSSVVPEPTFTP